MRLLSPYWMNRTAASDLFDEMDQFLGEWNRLPSGFKIYDERSFAPASEMSETENHFMMSVDLPGMKKDDIKIEMVDNVLTISGERKFEKTENKKIQRYEKTYGFFKRSFTLPATVDSDNIEAKYEDGVLEIHLPKIQAAKPRQIEIQSGKTGFLGKFLNSKKEEVEDKNANKDKVS
jgi:HSP20 family protein